LFLKTIITSGLAELKGGGGGASHHAPFDIAGKWNVATEQPGHLPQPAPPQFVLCPQFYLMEPLICAK